MNDEIILLHAEDEVETCQNHIDYLKDRYDFNYLEVNNGVEALELFNMHMLERVLTDIIKL